MSLPLIFSLQTKLFGVDIIFNQGAYMENLPQYEIFPLVICVFPLIFSLQTKLFGVDIIFNQGAYMEILPQYDLKGR